MPLDFSDGSDSGVIIPVPGRGSKRLFWQFRFGDVDEQRLHKGIWIEEDETSELKSYSVADRGSFIKSDTASGHTLSRMGR
jgi:hypothetical protein